MIALFKQKSPANIVLLLLFGLLIKIPVFLYPRPVQTTPEDGLLYQYLVDVLRLAALPSVLLSLLAFLLLYSQAMMVNYLVNEFRLVNRPNFLPAMAYLMVTSLWPDWNYLSAPLLASTIVIWALIRLFHSYNQSTAKGEAYNIGLLIGMSSFLFFPSAAFVICLLLGLLILRPPQVNEPILMLLGGLTPYYFYSVYLFLTDQLTLEAVFPRVVLDVPVVKSTAWLVASVVLIALPFFAGSFQIQLQLRKVLIQVRKNWSIMLLFLVLALFIPFINSNDAFHNWVLAVPAFAAFHAPAYLYPKKRWMPLLLFWVTTAFIVAQQWGTEIWK